MAKENFFNEDNRLGDFFVALTALYPEIQYKVESVTKSNRKVDSIVFKTADSVMGPCVPISDLCGLISNYGVTTMCDWIAQECEKVSHSEFDFNEMLGKDYVLDNVRVRVLNAEMNEHYEGKFVCRKWLNLLLVLAVGVTFPDKGSLCLSSSYAEELGLSEDELFEAALKNVSKDIVVLDMEDIICRAAGDEEPDEAMLQMAAMSRGMMYVVTNHSQCFGAAAMLCLDKVAEEIGPSEFYVLPSSVNDIIVCPANTGMPPEFLREMVCDVNAGPLVRDDEFLSNEIYFYDGSKLSIVE